MAYPAKPQIIPTPTQTEPISPTPESTQPSDERRGKHLTRWTDAAAVDLLLVLVHPPVVAAALLAQGSAAVRELLILIQEAVTASCEAACRRALRRAFVALLRPGQHHSIAAARQAARARHTPHTLVIALLDPRPQPAVATARVLAGHARITANPIRVIALLLFALHTAVAAHGPVQALAVEAALALAALDARVALLPSVEHSVAARVRRAEAILALATAPKAHRHV
eukprot:2916372-Rhodomonas_salina.2